MSKNKDSRSLLKKLHKLDFFGFGEDVGFTVTEDGERTHGSLPGTLLSLLIVGILSIFTVMKYQILEAKLDTQF